MKQREGFLAHLGQALNGLAYAELGENLSPAQKQAALAGVAEHPLPSVAAAPKPRRRVGLAVNHSLLPHALRYARNACARLDADLAVLTPDPAAVGGAVERERRSLAADGIQVELIPMGRDLVRSIHDFVRVSAGLLFVVVSADDAVTDQLMDNRGGRSRPEVPWVVVTNPAAI